MRAAVFSNAFAAGKLDPIDLCRLFPDYLEDERLARDED